MEPTNEQDAAALLEVQRDRRHPVMRMDFSVNIPTMLTMMGMIVSTTVAGVRLYNELDERQRDTNYAVTAQAARVVKLEESVTELKVEQTKRNTELRTEIKSDIGEIKGLLNEVIFGRRPNPNPTLKDWAK